MVRRAPQGDAGSALSGPARADRRTKRLTKRLRAGDIAVIDHEDLDLVAAQALIAAEPAAVVNAAVSITGRYPNHGPQALLDAGILLVDGVGPELLDVVREGEVLSVRDGVVLRGNTPLATGTEQSPELVADAMEAAKEGLSVQLEAFVANTMDYLAKERDLLIDRVGVPQLRTPIDGRPVLMVVRGYAYREDLAALRTYIRENRPVLIGVDGGADAILDEGYRPDLIVGDMDSVSDRALTCGAELIVHAYRDGRAPGLERVQGLGLDPVVFSATGTSEDIAMLLADDLGASVIVAVGTHNTLVEFLDKGRAGMSSTWLTRLRVGGKLVDAKGVSRLYRQSISNRQVAVLLFAGLFALAVAMSATPGGRIIFTLFGDRFSDLVSAVTGFFRDLTT